MCEFCHSTPCLPRCPNADEPSHLTCVECGNGIYADESYFDGNKGPICEDCLYEKSPGDILEMVGEKLSVFEGVDDEW